MSAMSGTNVTKKGNPYLWEMWCPSVFYDALEYARNDEDEGWSRSLEVAESGLMSLRCERCDQYLLSMVEDYFDYDNSNTREIQDIVDGHVLGDCKANCDTHEYCLTANEHPFFWVRTRDDWDAGKFDELTEFVMCAMCNEMIHVNDSPEYMTFGEVSRLVTGHAKSSCNFGSNDA